MFEQIISYNQEIPVHISGYELPERKIGRIGMLCETHLHKDYEFIMPTSGKIRCVTTDSEFILNPGDVIFLNSYIPHSTYSETIDMHYVLFQFNSPFITEPSFHYVTRFLRTADTPTQVFKNGTPQAEELKNSISAIADEYHNKPPFWKDFVHSHILMIMAILRRNGVISEYKFPKSLGFERITPALEYINENYAEQISTAELSKISNFSEAYFCRIFKKILGTTAMEYLNFVRVCKAEHLLKKGASVSDTAYQTGFASLSYFNRTFKKYKYYTPSEYKRISKNHEFDYSSEDLFT